MRNHFLYFWNLLLFIRSTFSIKNLLYFLSVFYLSYQTPILESKKIKLFRLSSLVGQCLSQGFTSFSEYWSKTPFEMPLTSISGLLQTPHLVWDQKLLLGMTGDGQNRIWILNCSSKIMINWKYVAVSWGF